MTHTRAWEHFSLLIQTIRQPFSVFSFVFFLNKRTFYNNWYLLYQLHIKFNIEPTSNLFRVSPKREFAHFYLAFWTKPLNKIEILKNQIDTGIHEQLDAVSHAV